MSRPPNPGPGGPEDLIRRAVPVMGTVVSIHVRAGAVPRPTVFLALADARDMLHRADAVFSTWKDDSPVSRLRRGELAVEDAPPEVAEVLARCEQARRLSAGWFDPWAAPGGVDPTGLVKGWAAAKALTVLAEAGVDAAMISAGGDVAVFGGPEPGRPWRIGVQNPFDRATVVAVANPTGAMATSGTYERGPHLYNPFAGRADRTGRGAGPAATAVASATVTGPELDLADALATAVAVGGEQAMQCVDSLEGYEALSIGFDGSMLRTTGFPDAPMGRASVAPEGAAV